LGNGWKTVPVAGLIGRGGDDVVPDLRRLGLGQGGLVADLDDAAGAAGSPGAAGQKPSTGITISTHRFSDRFNGPSSPTGRKTECHHPEREDRLD
jgi:hypothetical protein